MGENHAYGVVEVDKEDLESNYIYDYILNSLVDKNLISRSTSPRTLNKTYKLTDDGKLIYDYLKEHSK